MKVEESSTLFLFFYVSLVCFVIMHNPILIFYQNCLWFLKQIFEEESKTIFYLRRLIPSSKYAVGLKSLHLREMGMRTQGEGEKSLHLSLLRTCKIQYKEVKRKRGGGERGRERERKFF